MCRVDYAFCMCRQYGLGVWGLLPKPKHADTPTTTTTHIYYVYITQLVAAACIYLAAKVEERNNCKLSLIVLHFLTREGHLPQDGVDFNAYGKHPVRIYICVCVSYVWTHVPFLCPVLGRSVGGWRKGGRRWSSVVWSGSFR